MPSWPIWLRPTGNPESEMRIARRRDAGGPAQWRPTILACRSAIRRYGFPNIGRREEQTLPRSRVPLASVRLACVLLAIDGPKQCWNCSYSSIPCPLHLASNLLILNYPKIIPLQPAHCFLGKNSSLLISGSKVRVLVRPPSCFAPRFAGFASP